MPGGGMPCGGMPGGGMPGGGMPGGKGGGFGPEMGVDCPAIHWITLEEASSLTTEGFPPSAAVIAFGGKEFKGFFANAHHILQELIEDMKQVVFHDDADWKIFPEVAKAVKRAGGEETCYCVATCAIHGLWAVGLADGWKARENAAKMAMAIALTMGTDMVQALAMRYPEFGTICASAGLIDPNAAMKQNCRFTPY
mmetsp:Transcript_82330/g.233459  ORF Transcript_82330/g.233459 Transcript_82330/m.233459 type:complete len:196 (-) Transcript_82330:47-634(-)